MRSRSRRVEHARLSVSSQAGGVPAAIATDLAACQEGASAVQRSAADVVGLLQWARPLITMLFADHGEDEAFRHVVPPSRYFRFQAAPGAVRSPLDDASADNIRVLKRQAEMLVETTADELTDLARRLQVRGRLAAPLAGRRGHPHERGAHDSDRR